MDDIRSFGVGSVAGMIGKVVEMPFDTVKVRLQTQMPPTAGSPANPEFFSGSIDCFQKTLRHEGMGALYRGMASPLFGAALEAAVLFSIYGKLKNLFITQNAAANGNNNNRLPYWQICTAGAFTGFFTGLVLTPIELIKCRMQVQRVPAAAAAASLNGGGGVASIAAGGGGGAVFYTGALNCLSHTLRTDGLFGLFRGGISTILREIPGTAVWFGGYELACDSIVRLASSSSNGNNNSNRYHAPGPLTQIVSGAFAGCVYWLLPYPIDTIKTRIQTQPHPSSHWAVCKEIVRTEGVRGLYKGVGFTMIRAIPSSAITFFAYEQLLAALSNWSMPAVH